MTDVEVNRDFEAALVSVTYRSRGVPVRVCTHNDISTEAHRQGSISEPLLRALQDISLFCEVTPRLPALRYESIDLCLGIPNERVFS